MGFNRVSAASQMHSLKPEIAGWMQSASGPPYLAFSFHFSVLLSAFYKGGCTIYGDTCNNSQQLY